YCCSCSLFCLFCTFFSFVFFFFFFQAEDGIRDLYVTGVQTCALPIWVRLQGPSPSGASAPKRRRWPCSPTPTSSLFTRSANMRRSEERRVGKECRARGAPEQ